AVELNRVLVAPRTLVAHVVNEAGAPEIVQGLVRVEPSVAHRQATYLIQHDVTFSPNVTVSAPFAARVCEPSIRVDVRGNCYVGGIRGVPAGVDLWRFDLDPASPGYDPQLRNPSYLGQPDAFAPEDTSGGGGGGGGIDISGPVPAHAPPTPTPPLPRPPPPHLPPAGHHRPPGPVPHRRDPHPAPHDHEPPARQRLVGGLDRRGRELRAQPGGRHRPGRRPPVERVDRRGHRLRLLPRPDPGHRAVHPAL